MAKMCSICWARFNALNAGRGGCETYIYQRLRVAIRATPAVILANATNAKKQSYGESNSDFEESKYHVFLPIYMHKIYWGI